jgi:hypothetical protein
MNWIRKTLTENIELKLLAVALAVALWASVGSDPITEASFRVAVELTNIPRDLEVLTEQPTIQLWARGPSGEVRQATSGDFSVRVNAASVSGPGNSTFALDAARVSGPMGLKVVSLIPSEVRIGFERTASKEVPVEPQIAGAPMPGYRVAGYSVTPPEVKIEGPGSRVQSAAAASTDPLDVSALAEPRTFTTSVFVPDPLVRIVTPKAVRIRVEIQPVTIPAEPAEGNH